MNTNVIPLPLTDADRDQRGQLMVDWIGTLLQQANDSDPEIRAEARRLLADRGIHL